jgi:hypothetical protein
MSKKLTHVQRAVRYAMRVNPYEHPQVSAVKAYIAGLRAGRRLANQEAKPRKRPMLLGGVGINWEESND